MKFRTSKLALTKQMAFARRNIMMRIGSLILPYRKLSVRMQEYLLSIRVLSK